MFQIEPILWLQSLESPALTWLMRTVSALGYESTYAAILIILIFGIRLKQGMFVFICLLVAGIMVNGLKDGIQFPRPSDVDIRVFEPGDERPPLLVEHGAADSFWSFPTDEALEMASIQVDWSYGLPSGHVGVAAACFLGLALFFRSKPIFIFAIIWILLMALSRMYLGRHFLGDVLGGMVVGVSSVAIAHFLVKPFSDDNHELKSLLRLGIFAMIFTMLTPFIQILDKESIGRLLSVVAVFLFLVQTGFPQDEAPVWKRAVRVLITIVLYVVIDKIIDPIDLLNIADDSFFLLLVSCVISFAAFAGSIMISKSMKLYVPSGNGAILEN